MYTNKLQCLPAHLPVLPGTGAPPADSQLRSLYEEEEDGAQEERSREVFGLEKSFEVSGQQEEGQKEEGVRASELHVLLYSRKTGELMEDNMSV